MIEIFALAALVLCGATVVYVLGPLVRPREDVTAAGPGLVDEAVEPLLRRRADVRAAIRELESDLQLGSLDESTYLLLRGELEQQATEAARALREWEAEADSVLAQMTKQA